MTDGFKEVSLGANDANAEKPRKYVKYKELQPGTIIAEGIYQGSFTGGEFNSTTYYVDCGDIVVGLPSTGLLSTLIERANLERGASMIRVVYNGLEPIKKGPRAGQKAHSFKLFVKNAAA